jgi:hypothetical protein
MVNSPKAVKPYIRELEDSISRIENDAAEAAGQTVHRFMAGGSLLVFGLR